MAKIINLTLFVIVIFFMPINVAASSCIRVNNIELVAKVKSVKQINILKQYENRCLHVEDLNYLIKNLTNSYIEDGYLATKVLIPEQKPENGKLKVNVISGYLSDVEIENIDDEYLKNDFNNIIGKTVNIKEIEQAVENLNSLRSNKVDVSIEPGGEKGQTKIKIKNQKTKSIFFNLGVESSNDDEKQNLKSSSSISFENGFGLNDSLYFVEKHNLSGVGTKLQRNISTIWTFPMWPL